MELRSTHLCSALWEQVFMAQLAMVASISVLALVPSAITASSSAELAPKEAKSLTQTGSVRAFFLQPWTSCYAPGK